jgi:hypothetical protein
MAPANAYSLGGNVLAGVAGSPNVTGALNRAFGVTAQPTQQQYTFNPVTGQYVPVATISFCDLRRKDNGNIRILRIVHYSSTVPTKSVGTVSESCV